MRIASLILLFTTSALADGASLLERVDDVWRRIEDRHGRPDPDGALLQLHTPMQYVEYTLDREIARYPLWMENEWNAREDGLRFFVQSLNEFTFTNELQLKSQVPMGENGRFEIRVDRVERREGQSTLMRAAFGAENVGEGWFFGVAVTPRWEKEDIDLEVALGRETSAGRFRTRLIALDLFVDLAHALAEGRDAEVERSADQQDVPLAWAVDFQSAPLFGLRAEIYAGVVLPAATRYTFADERPGFIQDRDAALGGGLLEWHGDSPLWIGVSALHLLADTTWSGADPRSVAERLTEARLYAFGDLGPIRLAADTTRSVGRSLTQRPTPIEQPERRDHHEVRWTSQVRAQWIPHRVGLDLGLMRADREVVAGPADAAEGAEHRFVTRCILRFDSVWISIDTGWDLDPGDGIYDGSGFTLIAEL